MIDYKNPHTWKKGMHKFKVYQFQENKLSCTIYGGKTYTYKTLEKAPNFMVKLNQVLWVYFEDQYIII